MIPKAPPIIKRNAIIPTAALHLPPEVKPSNTELKKPVLPVPSASNKETPFLPNISLQAKLV